MKTTTKKNNIKNLYNKIDFYKRNTQLDFIRKKPIGLIPKPNTLQGNNINIIYYINIDIILNLIFNNNIVLDNDKILHFAN